MTGVALALILAAAAMHAGWNYFAKRAGGGVPFLWLCALLSTLIYAPLAIGLVVWQQPALGAAALGIVLLSGILHVAYFVVLQRGYRVGDLSVVYPLARGTGPLLASVAAIALLGERPTLSAFVGGLLIIVGVFVLAGGGRRIGSSGAARGTAYGLFTGCLIAAYTICDKYAVSAVLVPPLLLDYGSTLTRLALLAPGALRERRQVGIEWRAHRVEVIGVAVLTPLAYILVLTAMITTPVTYVAPAREISILIGVALGSRLLLERDAGRRLVAASMMLAGITAIALG